MENRVVITGIGVVSPNGVGREAFWKALVEGRNGIGTVTRFPVEPFSSHVGAEVSPFAPYPKIPPEHLACMDRAYQFAVTSAWEAVENSGLDFAKADTARAGVYMGVAVAGVEKGEPEFHTLRDRGVRELKPYLYQTW